MNSRTSATRRARMRGLWYGPAEQDRVVRGLYKARLAVINIGDTFTTGPLEAAYVINDLVQPAAVIP